MCSQLQLSIYKMTSHRVINGICQPSITLRCWLLLYYAFILFNHSCGGTPQNHSKIFYNQNRPEKCLADVPEVFPRIYPSYLKTKVYITIDVSPRVTHQMSTHLFAIFLDEVLGYERILINQYDDQFQLGDAIARLSGLEITNTVAHSLINLELWIPPDLDTADIQNTRWVKDSGNSLPPGRFGWFIPLELNGPVQQYYTVKHWQSDVRKVHWTILKNRGLVKAFDIVNHEHLTLITNNSRAGDNGYYCMSKHCNDGMFTPSQCVGQTCALLLTSYYNETDFVIEHITELNLYVRVVWLGPNLKAVYNRLLSEYTANPEPQRSLLVLYFQPSSIFRRPNNVITVAFKSCQLLNSTLSYGCKYELNRLAKFSWSKLNTMDKTLQTTLSNFRLNEEDFERLIDIYEQLGDVPDGEVKYRRAACTWMRQNSDSWTMWKIGPDRNIYIGGIFPLTGSAYHGAGIIRGALLAKDMINTNRSILSDYKLNIIVSDGKCRADSVMKAFIDYIVDSYYRQLIGVLGPACSETVEPLAGVSKHFKILVVSYSAEGASYSDKEQYPYFFRTIGENNHYIHVYLNFFRAMGWTRIAALTEDGQRYTEYLSHMNTLLEQNDVTLISNTKFPREREDAGVMRRYLEDLKRKRARIIIVDVYDYVARTVMCEAYKLEMTPREGYVWFLPTWLNTTWYDVDLYNREYNESVNCTTSEIILAANGYFSMTHAYLAPDDTMTVGNITVGDWKKRYTAITSNVVKGGTSNYAGFAYDAVWLYALALDKLMRQDPEAFSDLHSTNTTEKMVKLVQETDFMGVSGHIKFRGGPSRFSVINLMQWYNNVSHKIGHFTPKLGDNKPVILGGELQLNTSAMRWFTEDGQVPDDGALPPTVCTLDSLSKLFSVDCEKAFILLDILVGFILLGIVAFSVFCIRKEYNKKVRRTQAYLQKLGINMKTSDFDGLDRWEIKRECVVINRKLGEGAFGTVFGGEAELPDRGWVAVAVKTLKSGSSCEDKLSFLSEAEVMKRFVHVNIVKLLGVCTTEEPIYTIMEFMLYGDLKTYLLARRHLVSDSDDSEVSSLKLTRMATDVARALAYLAEHNYVHRDVASRNCLVNTERVVKLGDFGMTRSMLENNYYRFTRKGMLPVRWMPPESLQEGKFTTASDMWSFGVLLFEIITFGSFPFQGFSNHQVLEFVKEGNSLDIPKGTHQELERMMKSCWDCNPMNRPTAADVVRILEEEKNTRILVPCLDVPRSSIQLTNTDKVEIKIQNGSGVAAAGRIPPSGLAHQQQLPPQSHQQPPIHMGQHHNNHLHGAPHRHIHHHHPHHNGSVAATAPHLSHSQHLLHHHAPHHHVAAAIVPPIITNGLMAVRHLVADANSCNSGGGGGGVEMTVDNPRQPLLEAVHPPHAKSFSNSSSCSSNSTAVSGGMDSGGAATGHHQLRKCREYNTSGV